MEYKLYLLIAYSLATSVVIILMVVTRISKKERYKMMKKEKINLLIYSKEYVALEDDFSKELWDENQRLDAENKLLKKEVNSLTWSARAMVIGFLFFMFFGMFYREIAVFFAKFKSIEPSNDRESLPQKEE